MRNPTKIDAIAEDYTWRIAALVPSAATAMGLPGFDHLLEEGTPGEYQHLARVAAETLRALDAEEPVDETDRVTVAAMRERLTLEIELVQAGEHCGNLNNLECPMLAWRDMFDQMPGETTADWEVIASRLARVPRAIDGYIECLRAGIGTDVVPAERQVTQAIRQARVLAGPESYFVKLVQRGPETTVLSNALVNAAAETMSAYDRLADFLAADLAPNASPRDGVGRERYQRFSRYFVGSDIDLDETYAWGLNELAEMAAEQRALSVAIAGPGANESDAVAALDADPNRRLIGTDALQRWMTEVSGQAIADLDGTHFDLPQPLRRLECRIAPTDSGGIYYVPPSVDFTRPGRMWWSVPTGETEFSTWRERTTVYHEGVPGHHLQCGQQVYNSAELNLWRRVACWVSGHGEGWALYAERLMAEFGYLTDPGDLFGMVDAQRLRATRVVLDIGVHLGLPAPQAYGGVWDADKAWQLLVNNVKMSKSFLQFEWMRYLGWPGQAPSYKVGQRLWEGLRADALASGMTLKEFHSKALNLGALPMDVLRAAVLA